MVLFCLTSSEKKQQLSFYFFIFSFYYIFMHHIELRNRCNYKTIKWKQIVFTVNVQLVMTQCKHKVLKFFKRFMIFLLKSSSFILPKKKKKKKQMWISHSCLKAMLFMDTFSAASLFHIVFSYICSSMWFEINALVFSFEWRTSDVSLWLAVVQLHKGTYINLLFFGIYIRVWNTVTFFSFKSFNLYVLAAENLQKWKRLRSKQKATSVKLQYFK